MAPWDQDLRFGSCPRGLQTVSFLSVPPLLLFSSFLSVCNIRDHLIDQSSPQELSHKTPFLSCKGSEDHILFFVLPYSVGFLLISHLNIQLSSQTLYFTVISVGQEVTVSMCVPSALLMMPDIHLKTLQKRIHYPRLQ